MCLMIWHSTKTEFTFEDIEDFYIHNKDGIGVMYVENNRVRIHKKLPDNAKDVWKFYLKYAAKKECALHFRMRTHGLVDLENCHPYKIPQTNIWLMHNGILHTGNYKDKTKSDTWHYINDFLQPMLLQRPNFMFHSAFKELISTHIGDSNKFILLSPKGHCIVNKSKGVYYKNAWLSNTYAWTAAKLFESEIIEAVKYFLELTNIKKLSSWEIMRFVKKVGVDEFYEFCNTILCEDLTEEEIIDYINSGGIICGKSATNRFSTVLLANYSVLPKKKLEIS